jgi:hypothetical protein
MMKKSKMGPSILDPQPPTPTMPHPPPPGHDAFMFEEQKAFEEHVLQHHRPKIALDREAFAAASWAAAGAWAGSWFTRNPSIGDGWYASMAKSVRDFADMAQKDPAGLIAILNAAMLGSGLATPASPAPAGAKKKSRAKKPRAQKKARSDVKPNGAKPAPKPPFKTNGERSSNDGDGSFE